MKEDHCGVWAWSFSHEQDSVEPRAMAHNVEFKVGRRELQVDGRQVRNNGIEAAASLRVRRRRRQRQAEACDDKHNAWHKILH